MKRFRIEFDADDCFSENGKMVNEIKAAIEPIIYDAHQRNNSKITMGDLKVGINVPQTRAEAFVEADKARELEISNWQKEIASRVRYWYGLSEDAKVVVEGEPNRYTVNAELPSGKYWSTFYKWGERFI